jgi:LPXTG-site transpeptidase (sortase) family protein
MSSRKKNRYTLVGILCTSIALCILLFTFAPVTILELRYNLSKKSNASETVQPVSTEFGIVIPKIGANAKVIPQVNPYDSKQYQQALTLGVAHAGGSALPGAIGNIFIFSHSSVNFYDALRYNSIFYLLDKLEKNDTIILYYTGNRFTYHVTNKKIVSPDAIQYLTAPERYTQMLTLMTCWPPGTSYKRLLVLADRD